MKSILLASASIVAFSFAGAAAAEVAFTGEATLGFNDTDSDGTGDDEGFYWDANLAVSLSQELDNGVVAAAAFDFDFADDSLGEDLMAGGYLLSLTSDNAGLFFGDTAFAAETYWDAAGSMAADAFSEADGETVLRGELTFGTVTGGISYVVADAGEDLVGDSLDDSVDQLSLGGTAEFGNFTVAMAYQEESDRDLTDASVGDGTGDGGVYDPEDENGDFNGAQVFGLSVSTAFAGADVTVAYANEDEYNGADDRQSLGAEVSYPFGPVVVTAFYVAETQDGDDADDNYGATLAYAQGPVAAELSWERSQGAIVNNDEGDTEWSLEGSYDVGNGLTVLAGVLGGELEDGTETGADFYIAGEYDLGSGATLLVSYADDEGDDAGDEIGGPEYQEGTTVEVTFEF